MHVGTCVWVCMHAYVCEHVQRVHECAHVGTCGHMCMCLWLCMHVGMSSARMYVDVQVSVCMWVC